MKSLVNEIEKLETLAKIYNDKYGPSSEEVKNIDQKIRDLNLKILDIMCPE